MNNFTKQCDGLITVFLCCAPKQKHIQLHGRPKDSSERRSQSDIPYLSSSDWNTCIMPLSLRQFHPRLTRRKMWLHTSRLLRNYTLEPPSHHICGLDIPYQRRLLLVFFLQKNTSGRVTESLFKERRLLHFNYCFYCRVQ